ncbi:MAG: DUF763 domain-containing protein [Candidatus Nealsonbacteria bacterium CG_4_10_14_0_2_um_filter_40_15]|uniref:DUF763 domain-containing protein n=1 Tax=Candidatus Nealsonbacteria bacterium CG_4_10_14_0_2_um_filter_40_15 TaxID=1974682 RepID=A0A2M7UUZ7_9BACT|nr:MAG: DUF763 domain-containing protein [Candidatus Nealsonbacteria bacterium CG_4_10_14_0_2_um_filter_40_15]
MRTGIATVPLDYGRCPRWLFERMERLGRGIAIAIVEEFGPEEFLKRLSDPVWFQSLGCVMGFDWNSSGLTVTTLGALKAGLFEIQDRLGIYVCGGKRESRKTPEEIEAYGISRQFSFAPNLIYASKMAAKVDSSLIQSGYQIYQHNFLFTKSGNWVVVQQGMNTGNQTARRYHWLSSILMNKKKDKPDFIEEPHSGIASQIKGKPLNLTAKESDDNRTVSLGLVKEEPKKFLKDLDLIQTKREKNITSMSLPNKEFFWHPVVKEKFDLKRLQKTIFAVNDQKPEDFEKMLSLKGVGPKTIRALSLVAEIIYGAKPSYEDPARYTFCVGGKDNVPMPIDKGVYDRVIEIMGKGIKKSDISLREKAEAQRRLSNLT